MQLLTVYEDKHCINLIHHDTLCHVHMSILVYNLQEGKLNTVQALENLWEAAFEQKEGHRQDYKLIGRNWTLDFYCIISYNNN